MKLIQYRFEPWYYPDLNAGYCRMTIQVSMFQFHDRVPTDLPLGTQPFDYDWGYLSSDKKDLMAICRISHLDGSATAAMTPYRRLSINSPWNTEHHGKWIHDKKMELDLQVNAIQEFYETQRN